MTPELAEYGASILSLVRELHPLECMVVSNENQKLFDRLGRELPLTVHRYPSGSSHNGWVVPPRWSVEAATISRDGQLLFDGTDHVLGVAMCSQSFTGTLAWEELKQHLVTHPPLPDAYLWHSKWQYRPWERGWALCVPYQLYQQMGPGRYEVELRTRTEPGEMLVGETRIEGRSPLTIVLNAHTCHPRQANDDMAGVALLVRLFQWLQTQSTYYSYRLVLAPEHIGTVFYLRDQGRQELAQCVAGAFAEMPGAGGPIKIASSFLGDQPIDLAFRNAARHHSNAPVFVPWRLGAGNDETVWEAPGYEIPFVEVSRALDLYQPYPEYHSSRDTPEILDPRLLGEFYKVFVEAIGNLERRATAHRRFDGLICLSNPEYDLYIERRDPADSTEIDEEGERWGRLLDSLLRYFDGRISTFEIAERHQLPLDRLHQYLERFVQKGLIDLQFRPIERAPISHTATLAPDAGDRPSC